MLKGESDGPRSPAIPFLLGGLIRIGKTRSSSGNVLEALDPEGSGVLNNALGSVPKDDEP